MTSTFLGLEIGRRGMMAHQTAQHVTGHNLTNLNTEGFSRQRVALSAFEPIFMPGLERAHTAGQIGQGVIVDRIERVRDEFLDRRIVAQAAQEGYWTVRSRYIRQMEQLHLETGGDSIRNRMDSFWDGWQELANHPADNEFRTAVTERGRSLVDSIQNHFHNLDRMRTQVNSDIELTVAQINELTRQIAGLNGDIQRITAIGDNANDLMDRRDLLVDRLSSMIEVSVTRRDPDEYMLHTAGRILVQGANARQFDLRTGIDTEGFAHVYWRDTDQMARFARGSLGALLELRDVTIQEEIQNLDNMTMNFVDLVNEIHRSAYGANMTTGLDFFTEFPFVTNIYGNFDTTGDGEFDSSFIYRVNGQNALDPRAQPGLSGIITLSGPLGPVEVPYFPTDTVADIITRINNSGAEVVARLNRDGALSLRATPAQSVDGVRLHPDFVIRHIEDTGHFLTGYAGLLAEAGPDGAFMWDVPNAVAALVGGAESYAVSPVSHPSGWIEVNPALLRDPGSVAAGFGFNQSPANIGNGEAAQAIASIRNTHVMVGSRAATFDDFFADTVGRIAVLGEQAGRAVETEHRLMRHFQDWRQSVSGVSVDEELSNMIRFQHGFNASAQFINTVNSMLDIIINRLGA